MKPVRVIVSAEQRVEALEYSEKVTKIVEARGPNYTGLTGPKRFFTGRVGEFAFGNWAKERGVRHEETVRDDGLSDAQDFLIWDLILPNKLRLNVKNTLHPRGQKMMQPVSQAEKFEGKHDIYCGMRGYDNGEGREIPVDLYGAIDHDVWVKRRRLKNYSIPTYELRLDLLPITMESLEWMLEKD